ncbi:MAG: 4-phosphoerythronate dehydrogenase [Acidobacteriia bacterium]|nr:4-phosphoerythronate dehydrogenase [Terriglobia bacterium]
MRILADRNIPFVKEAFRELGEVAALDTPLITNQRVREADILIVRSEIPVDEKLLRGTPVRFVGSATAGTDHIDTDYLRSSRIAFANSPGCNSNSVKEYVVAALLAYASRNSLSLRGKTLGVVGVGNVGSKVVRAAEALGMIVLQNDPPLARTTDESRFVPLNAILEADFITLHVPLTRGGPDPTYHLLDQVQFDRMKQGAVLLNTARGPVVSTTALKHAFTQGRLSAALLDVWENEPGIDIEALLLAAIGTAHVAGYSMDGKMAAVGRVREAVCQHFGFSSAWDPALYLRSPEPSHIELNTAQLSDETALHRIVRRAYNIEEDDVRLRVTLSLPPQAQAAHFTRLRTGYPYRREFSSFTVDLPPEYSRLESTLSSLSFPCSTARSGRQRFPAQAGGVKVAPSALSGKT